MRQELGLDKSKFQQYVIYLKDLAHGDFGRSFQNRQPVLPQLWQPLENTLPMLLLGTFFSIVLGLITGVIAAWRRGTLVGEAYRSGSGSRSSRCRRSGSGSC